MIIRNGLLSVVRTPVRSILFSVLSIVLAASVTLGTTLLFTCDEIMKQCDDTYITSAVIEYQGGMYPERNVLDETSRRLHDEMDLAALADLPCVTGIDESRVVPVHIPDFVNITKETADPNVVVLKVAMLSSFPLAQVREVLYSTYVSEGAILDLTFHQPTAWDDETQPDPGRRNYLICGHTNGKTTGVIGVDVDSVLNAAAIELGETLDCPFVDITERGLDPSDPRQAPFFEIAEACRFINSGVYAQISPQPEMLEPFSQDELSVKSGAIYTPEDAKSGTCCLLPEYIAGRIGVSAGDSIRLGIMPKSSAELKNSYWPSLEPTYIDCRVTGIISTAGTEKPWVYLSDDGGTGCEGTVIGYTLSTLRLRNGTPPDEIEQLRDALPASATMTVYDQGYELISQAMSELRRSAAEVTALAVIAVLVLLVLFAFLFVGRQKDALATMYMLGTTRRKLVAYVLSGAGVILFLSAALGGGAASALSGYLSDLITRTLSSADSPMLMYSNSNMGITRKMTAAVSMPWFLILACCGGFVLVGAALCLAFMYSGLRADKKEPRKKKKTQKKVSPRQHAGIPMNGAQLKYMLLSVIRGGMRSVVVPLMCVVLSIFLITLAFALDSYKLQRTSLAENTEITGYFTDYGGRSRSNLVLYEHTLTDMEESDLFTGFQYCCTDPFTFSCVSSRYAGRDASGQPIDEPVSDQTAESVPNGGFALDSFMQNMLCGPRIVYTGDIGATPQFANEENVNIRWLEGYGDEFFSEERPMFEGIKVRWRTISGLGFTFDKDLRRQECVVSESFLEENGIELGDKMILLVSEDLAKVEYRVVGAVADSSGNIYTRTENSVLPMYADQSNHAVSGAQTDPPVIGGVAPIGYSSGVFKLRLASDLEQAKLFLLDAGYSRVRDTSRYRIYPIFEDAAYRASLDKLDSNIGYLSLLLPVLSALVLLAGIVAAYLMAGKRRAEIATMRSVGATVKNIKRIFFSEQLVLCTVGALAAAIGWMCISSAGWYLLMSAVFVVGYLAGYAAALNKISRDDLLEVLGEKE